MRALALAIVLMGCGTIVQASGQTSKSGAAPRVSSAEIRPTLYGLSTFPYDRSPEAVEQTFRMAAEYSDLYVVQLDDGVPWTEALGDTRFPDALQRKWRDLKSHAPAGRPVYLALQPLGHDRVNLASPVEGSSVPRGLRGAAFDAEVVKTAYFNYTRRTVRFFQPAFLNLGVENGELAYRKPGDWAAYVRLIKHVITALKSEFPSLRMGISFGLQSLMEPMTARRARELVDASDYLGLSFYPYMSNFHEKFGVSPLRPPPDEWRKPLDWVRSYTDKPIAICETGYNTAGVELPHRNIRLRGSAALQKQYIQEVAGYAARDGYLFVVYYLPVDIGAILDALPPPQRSEGNMWRENGLFDPKLNPKPALEVWRAILSKRYEPRAVQDRGPAREMVTGATKERVERSAAAARIGFQSEQDLCRAPAPARVELVEVDGGEKGMLWRYERRPGAWAWCARKFESGAFPGGSGMTFRIRSDVDEPVILQLKEANGEAHFAIIPAGVAWREVSLKWTDFVLDEKTRRNGLLEPANVVEIVLGDEGKKAPGSGQTRRIWLSEWVVR